MTRHAQPDTITCHRGEDGRRIVDHRHVRDCNLSGCPGCAPCTEDHCTRCGHAHLDAQHPLTCPSCIGQARHDILSIGEAITEAHDQAIARARVTSTAFALAVPAANYEAYTYVRQAARSGALCKCHTRGETCPETLPDPFGPVCERRRCAHESCRAIRMPRACPDAAFILEETRFDRLNPASVFGSWDLTWRRVIGHDPAPDDVTTWGYATYLLANLTYAAQLDDAGFPDFARDLADCKRWLEDLLRTGKRPDQGETCPSCGKARLVRDWDPDWREGHDGAPADMWVCPNAGCAQIYTEADYRARVQGIWLGVAPALPASELATLYRVSEATIRKWAERGKVRKMGHDTARRQLYSREDVIAARETAPA